MVMRDASERYSCSGGIAIHTMESISPFRTTPDTWYMSVKIRVWSMEGVKCHLTDNGSPSFTSTHSSAFSSFTGKNLLFNLALEKVIPSVLNFSRSL